MESLNEIILKYKILQSWKRSIITIILGLFAPVAYSYLQNEISIMESTKEDSQNRKDQTEAKLNELIKKKKDAPRLEEQIKFTQEQLVEARKHLPDNYFIDQMLNKTGLAAMRAKVELLSFTPKTESLVANEEPYMELPLMLKVRGDYASIGQFVDNLVHFENMVHVRNLEMKEDNRRAANNAPIGSSPGGLGPKPLAFRIGEEIKDKKLEASMELVIFRSLRNGENAGGAAPTGAPLKEKAAKPALPADGEAKPGPAAGGGDSGE